MRSYSQHQKKSRNGMTIIEMMIAMGIATIMALSVCAVMVTTFRTLSTETQQNMVNWNAQQLIYQFTADCEMATAVVYAGTSSFANPNNAAQGTNQTFPAATHLLVIEIPSYDANGIITGDYDYVGYAWDSAGKTVKRICYHYSVGATTSLRYSTTGVMAAGGDNITAENLQIHDSKNSAAATKDKWVDPFGGSPLPASEWPFVDEVSLDVTSTAISWGQSVNEQIQTTCRLRNGPAS